MALLADDGPIPVWARDDVARFAGYPDAASHGGPNVTVASDSNAAIGLSLIHI